MTILSSKFHHDIVQKKTKAIGQSLSIIGNRRDRKLNNRKKMHQHHNKSGRPSTHSNPATNDSASTTGDFDNVVVARRSLSPQLLTCHTFLCRLIITPHIITKPTVATELALRIAAATITLTSHAIVNRL